MLQEQMDYNSKLFNHNAPNKSLNGTTFNNYFHEMYEISHTHILLFLSLEEDAVIVFIYCLCKDQN